MALNPNDGALAFELPIAAALGALHERLASREIVWAITGSLGLALKGMPQAVRDIDIQTDRAGAYAIETLFRAEIVRPVRETTSGVIRSHYGAFALAGTEIEIMGDVQFTIDGGWGPPIDLSSARLWVMLNGMRLPVVPIEEDRRMYERIGRAETVARIDAWLAEGSSR